MYIYVGNGAIGHSENGTWPAIKNALGEEKAGQIISSTTGFWRMGRFKFDLDIGIFYSYKYMEIEDHDFNNQGTFYAC